MKKTIIYIIAFIILLIFVSIAPSFTNENNRQSVFKEELLNIDYEIESNETALNQYDTSNPIVAMYIKNYGSIVIELYPDKAENTVNNFISLVKSGFYDNNTFHRLVPGFVLQGGDPEGKGTGGPGYNIEGEFSKNGYQNDLKHKKAIVSMARSDSYNSAGSQFFIMLGEASYLDGAYAAFGKVIDGWDIIEKISKTEKIDNESTGKLHNNLTIKKAIIDLKGKEYNNVKKVTE